MILVRNIGISGYVPLECVVGLSHAILRYRLDKCDYKYGFEYLGVGEFDKTYNLEILSSVVSFAIVHHFDDSARFIIIHDVGLLPAYYCAGVVFPNKLLHVFRDIMGLSEYYCLSRPSHHPHYFPLEFTYTSAWYEYICLEPDVSYVYNPPIFIRVLGHRNPFPIFTFDEWRRVLSQLRRVLSY